MILWSIFIILLIRPLWFICSLILFVPLNTFTVIFCPSPSNHFIYFFFTDFTFLDSTYNDIIQYLSFSLTFSLRIEKTESVSHLVVSYCLLPHGLKPSRLLYPWNSPGKNTGVSSHSLLQGIFPTQELGPGLLHCRQILYHLSHHGIPSLSTESESHSVVSDSLWPHGLHSPWNSPGQNTTVGRHSHIQGIFLTQELNRGLVRCRWIL